MNIGSLQKRVKLALGFPVILALAACEAEAPVAEAPSGGIAEGEVVIPVMGEEVSILAFGDSLFAGYGLSDPEGDSYPAKLEAAMRAQGINAAITNAGVSGDTSAAGLSRLAFTLDAQEETPDFLILELGGNDLLRAISPEETRANFEAMLDILREREIPVLLMGMRAPGNYGPEYVAQYDEMYAELSAQYNTALIPFWLEDVYEDASLFQNDRIHPTAEGIEAIVASTLDDVVAALPESDEG